METTVTFRSAERADVPLILQFIRALADYEHMADQVVADEATLEEWLFDRQKAEVLFAVLEGREVGFALFFHTFSTFLGDFVEYEVQLNDGQELTVNEYTKDTNTVYEPGQQVFLRFDPSRIGLYEAESGEVLSL